MKRAWELDRSLDHIRVLAGSGLDHQALRKAVLGELGRTLPFDAFVWPLCDPRTTVGMAPRARIPCPRELPALIRLKYLSEPARWTGLMDSSSPALSLQHATRGEPALSVAWRGVMKGCGVRDVLSAVFADKHGCWAWLDLWRTGTATDFTLDEARYLGKVAAELTAGLRSSVAGQFQAGRALEAGEVFQSGTGQRDLPEQAVLTLDEDLSVAGQTASVAGWLRLLQPGPSPHHQVPAEVLNVAAQLLAREAGVDAHDAECRVHIGEGRWAMLRAARMDSGQTGAVNSGQDAAAAPLAVTIQGCPPSDRLDMFARSFGLTPRQRELLLLAAAGADTGTMAEAQGVTSYTVQDQFKQIFQACGVHSRASMLAKALGS